MKLSDYKESLRCIREVIQSVHIGVEYTHKQYHEAFHSIKKLLEGVGI